MNFAESLIYLEKIQNLGIKFGLDNVDTLLTALDSPHKKFPSILVAGSNGKGSVCAMLVRILCLHGLRPGMYTSPHLTSYQERIRIGDELISRRDFAKTLTALKEEIEGLIAAKKLVSPPTHFELLTCLAFLYFSKKKVDIAVLEVGMGGRFDATNIVRPLVSVITTISGEHQKFLGETLSQIAFEKAGIIKPGVPVVSGVESKEASETIKGRAQELGAPLFEVFSPPENFISKKEKNGYSFEYLSPLNHYFFKPSLVGEHQGKNAAIAVSAAEQISKVWKPLAKDKIQEGIDTAVWHGRLEVISRSPFIILDGAHNEEGATALKKYIEDFLKSPIILLFAIMRDKKIEELANILFPLADKVILTRFSYHRAASPEEVKKRVPKFHDRIFMEPDLHKSFNLALEFTGASGALIVAGSLFLVGEVKKIDLPQNHCHQKDPV